MRVTRTRTAQWKLNWKDKEHEYLAYLGRWLIGSVTRERAPHRAREIVYAARVHLPGIVGPIAYEQSRVAASQKVLEKVQEWMEGACDEIPVPYEGRTRARKPE